MVAPAAGVAAVLQYYRNELLLPRREKPRWPASVVAVGEGTVTLRGEDAGLPGIMGLTWPDSNASAQEAEQRGGGRYARLGPVLRANGGGVVREYRPFPDTPEAGTRARVDHYAMPVDLSKLEHVDAHEITYAGELGRYPATFFPGRTGGPAGRSDRWVIFVHGHRGDRAAGFRMLTSLAEFGHPCLSISYRNDPDAPADPSGLYGLGLTEVRDVAAAIGYAREHGAADVVLVGYSMGGAIVGHYLRTETDHVVRAVIYDSPVLSWTETLAHQAGSRTVPGPLVRHVVAAIRARAKVDLDALDQLRQVDELRVPILLIHGTADESVPVTSSDRLAEARPDLVTYVRPEGVGHVLAWNADPEGYEATTRRFMESLPGYRHV